MSPNPAITPTARARRSGDPRPDLTDYTVVHRAMVVAFRELATAAAELVDAPDARRTAALRRYLEAISGEIANHHHVEDAHVWPLLVEVVGDQAALPPLTEDHEQLDPVLARAAELAAAEPSAELAAVLDEIATLLERHIADEERDVFPLFREYVRVEDYATLQEQFRKGLPVRLLPFVACWMASHATPAEREHLLAEAGWLLRVLLLVYGRRFEKVAALVRG